MSIAAATTRYQIVTSYRTETGAAVGNLRQYRQATIDAGGALRSTQAATRMHTSSLAAHSAALAAAGRSAGSYGASLAGVLAMAGRVAGPLAVIVGGYQAVGEVFTNLNKKQESLLSLSALINANVTGIVDPMARFTASSQIAARFYGEIAKNAAALPGELPDFIQAAQLSLSPVFAAMPGASVDRALAKVNDLAGQLSIVRTAFGIDSMTANSQMAAMLTGGAGRDQALFRMLQPFGLGDAQGFNALAPAQRLEVLSGAMSKIADHPLVRQGTFSLLATQMGTLRDNLFGAESILSTIGANPFRWLVGGLTYLNDAIDQNEPRIVAGLQSIGGEIEAWGRWLRGIAEAIPKPPDWMLPYLGGSPMSLPLRMAGITPDDTAGAARSAYGGLKHALGVRTPRGATGVWGDEPSTLRTAGAGRTGGTGGLATAAREVIQQSVTIYVDLKSDDSPEGIAVKLAQAMEKAEKHPTRSRRLPTQGSHGRSFRN